MFPPILVARASVSGLDAGVMTETATLDSFDRALLDEVRRNNLTPARALADRVGLSESAVLRRLRRLRASGVIAADVSVVRADAFGRSLTMHVLVTMERDGTAAMAKFERGLRARPEVRAAWAVAGGIAYVLFVEVPDMEAYEVFARTSLSDNPDVRSYRTLITMRQVIDPATAPLRLL